MPTPSKSVQEIITQIEKIKTKVNSYRISLQNQYKEIEKSVEDDDTIGPLLNLDNNIESVNQCLRFLDQSIQSLSDSVQRY